MQVLFLFDQSFCCDFSFSSPPHRVNCCTPCDKKQKRTYNIPFTLLKRGNESNTVRPVSVSVHDIYSSAFYLAPCSFVFILSHLHLPSIILCHSQRENLIALTNKVSWDRQQLKGTMCHKDSERDAGRHGKNNNIKSV